MAVDKVCYICGVLNSGVTGMSISLSLYLGKTDVFVRFFDTDRYKPRKEALEDNLAESNTSFCSLVT